MHFPGRAKGGFYSCFTVKLLEGGGAHWVVREKSPPHHNAMWATTAILTWWIKFSQVIAAADRKWCGRQPAMGIFEPSTLDINVLADPTGLAGTAHFIIQLHPGVGESFSLIGGSPVFPCQVCENFLGTDPVLNEVSPLMKSSSLR